MPEPTFMCLNFGEWRTGHRFVGRIDELCECGQLQTVHDDGVLAPGHGPCNYSGCEQFTWKQYVFVATDYVSLTDREMELSSTDDLGLKGDR